MMRIALHTTIVLAIVAGMALLWQLRSAALVLFLSLSLAAALRPGIEKLTLRGLPKPLALLTIYLAVLALFTSITVYAVGECLRELKDAADDWVEAYDYAANHWSEGNQLQQLIARRMPSPEDLYAVPAQSSGQAMVEAGVGLTFNLVHFLVGLTLMFVLSIYWNIDRVYFERLWLSLLPLKTRTQAAELWRAIEAEAGAYFGSEVLQSLLAAGVLALGFRAIGYPYPALAAVVCAAAWLIPWVGIVLSMTAVFALSLAGLILPDAISLTTGVLAVLFTLLVMLALEMIVEPRVFNRKRYNTLLVAVTALGLAEVVGVVGLVLGPPLAACAQILIGHWLRQRGFTTGEPTPPWPKIQQQLLALRESVERIDRPSPELVSFVSRLASLAEDAELLLEGPPGGGRDRHIGKSSVGNALRGVP